MTPEQIEMLGMLGSWANALAMGAAAVFAFMAWRSDRGGAAIARVDALTVSLTAGSVAVARDRLTAWVEEHRGEQPPANVQVGTPGHPLREFAVTDDEEREVRHGVFEILWLLHRCPGLIQDLRRTDKASRDVVLRHLSLVVKALNAFASELSEGEIEAFRESALAANGALVKLKETFPTLSDGAGWESALTELTPDDVVEFCTELTSGGRK